MDPSGTSNTNSAETKNRRPLRSRKIPIFQKLTSALVTAGVSPNGISLASIGAGVLAGVALASTNHIESSAVQRLTWLLAAGLIQLRLLCNMLDGMVAVEAKKFSPTGELYNEVPDRISDAATLIGLGLASGSSPWLGYLAACVALLIAYVRAQGKASGAPYFFTGPMAKPHRMAAATVTCILMAALPIKLSIGFWGPSDAWGLSAICLWIVILGGAWTTLARLKQISQYLHGAED